MGRNWDSECQQTDAHLDKSLQSNHLGLGVERSDVATSVGRALSVEAEKQVDFLHGLEDLVEGIVVDDAIGAVRGNAGRVTSCSVSSQ